MFDGIIKDIAARFGLGDKAGDLLRMLLAAMTDADKGGLVGFVERFKRAGFADVVQSWLGGASGAPQALPTTNTQVEQVLGGPGGLVDKIATRLGLGGSTVSSAIAYALPLLMGKLAQGGQLPAALPAGVSGFIGNGKDLLKSGAAAVETGRGGLMKWLPWVVLAVAVAFLINQCSKSDTAKTAAVAPAAPAVVNVPAPTSGTPVADATKAGADAVVDATKSGAGAVADAAKAVASAAAGAAQAAIDAIPTGAGALSSMVDGQPALKVYFDTGKAEISPEFAARAQALVDYLKANPQAKAVVSGYSDPTGSAAANAEMSKQRAQAVASALQAAGVAGASIVLEKPTDVTGTGDTNAESRRVEVLIRK